MRVLMCGVAILGQLHVPQDIHIHRQSHGCQPCSGGRAVFSCGVHASALMRRDGACLSAAAGARARSTCPEPVQAPSAPRCGDLLLHRGWAPVARRLDGQPGGARQRLRAVHVRRHRSAPAWPRTASAAGHPHSAVAMPLVPGPDECARLLWCCRQVAPHPPAATVASQPACVPCSTLLTTPSWGRLRTHPNIALSPYRPSRTSCPSPLLVRT